MMFAMCMCCFGYTLTQTPTKASFNNFIYGIYKAMAVTTATARAPGTGAGVVAVVVAITTVTVI